MPAPGQFYVYEHFDPATKEVVYVGKGCRGRAWVCEGRTPPHTRWIAHLLACGHLPDQFVRIRARGLSDRGALAHEKTAIHELHPQFNLNYGQRHFRSKNRAPGEAWDSSMLDVGFDA